MDFNNNGSRHEMPNVEDDMLQDYLAKLSLPTITTSESENPVANDANGSNNTNFNMQDNLDLNLNNLSPNGGDSSLDIETFKNTWDDDQHRQGSYLSPFGNNLTSSQRPGFNDNESIYSSSSFRNVSNDHTNTNNNDALSPAISYLTTGDEDHDDLSSIYSGNSNYLLPVNSHGLKHVSDLDELDLLLLAGDSAIENSIEQMDNSIDNMEAVYNTGLIQKEPLGSYVDSSDATTPFTPTIELHDYAESSVPEEITGILNNSTLPAQNQHVPIINIVTNNSQSFDVDSFSDNTKLIDNNNKTNNNSNINNLRINVEGFNDSLFHESLLTSEEAHNQMRKGRRNRSRGSTSRHSSRTRSISPESKARSLSANREKLLEMAALVPESPGTDSPQAITQLTIDNSHSFDDEIFTSPTVQISTEKAVIPIPLEEGETPQNLTGTTRRQKSKKNPSIYACTLCDKKFTRPYNLKSHLRTHTNERPFPCTICGKAFAREHDRKRHEDLHTGKKRYVCGGRLKNGEAWGCGKKFARSDALGRHFKTETGRRCITPLYQEAARERELIGNVTHEELMASVH